MLYEGEIKTCRETVVDHWSVFLQSSHGRDIVHWCSTSSDTLHHSQYSALQSALTKAYSAASVRWYNMCIIMSALTKAYSAASERWYNMRIIMSQTEEKLLISLVRHSEFIWRNKAAEKYRLTFVNRYQQLVLLCILPNIYTSFIITGETLLFFANFSVYVTMKVHIIVAIYVDHSARVSTFYLHLLPWSL